ncbi:hypothetical protein [Saccharolobus sp. E5-1-F]|nr:hypothetical protein [Sulfolobus sp. E5-1-F]
MIYMAHHIGIPYTPTYVVIIYSIVAIILARECSHAVILFENC